MSSNLKSLGFCGEPTIDELLSDPVAQVIMRHDGIDEAVVRCFIAQAQQRMRRHDRAA